MENGSSSYVIFIYMIFIVEMVKKFHSFLHVKCEFIVLLSVELDFFTWMVVYFDCTIFVPAQYVLIFVCECVRVMCA